MSEPTRAVIEIRAGFEGEIKITLEPSDPPLPPNSPSPEGEEG